MTKDSTKKDKSEEESTSLSPQKEVKGRPAPADYKKAEWFFYSLTNTKGYSSDWIFHKFGCFLFIILQIRTFLKRN